MAVSRRSGASKTASPKGTSSSTAKPKTHATPQPDQESEPVLVEAPASPAEPETDNPSPPFRLQQRLRQTSALTVSAIIHLVAIVTLGLLVIEPQAVSTVQEVIAQVMDEPDPQDELKVELENQLSDVQETTQVFSSSPVVGVVGASGPQGMISAPTMDRALLEQVVNSAVNVEGVFIDVPASRKMIVEAPDGQVGDARAVVGSYSDALDRITQEILWMLEKSPVLVVWAFDQSESMKDDQREIRERIEHVYEQLGLVNKGNDHALETAVVSYGDLSNFKVHTKLPTYNRDEIMSAIDEVPMDRSGKEYMCSAVIESIAKHRQYAQRTKRRMALIVVTDESGERADNESQLERAIAEARAARCRIYMLGREAVFGYPLAHIRWVHPQTKRTHWLPIDRGPETAFAEELQTDGFHRRFDAHPAGFGPYECTRLGRETGGIFFMLPSLETNLVRGQKINYDIQAPYYPDMRSRLEVKSEIDRSPLRSMLEKVIYEMNPYNPEARKIIELRVEFATDYETLTRQIQQELSKATVYLPYLARVEQTVGKLQRERQYEASPRWQANYDLLSAQLVAYQARVYEYAAYLEQFQQDVQAYVRNPADPKNKFKPPAKASSASLLHEEWHIRSRARTLTGDKIKPYVERSTAMFKEIIASHPGTPWAARADYELKRGFGVELVPHYEYPNVPGAAPPPKF